jgi:Zn-dependent peptidase ImmA (M78 family)/transcriptional regulator with XRE-family HTH domain
VDNLGARIESARQARGLTQAEVAAAVGVSRPTYIAVESGRRRPGPEELARLAELLGVSAHELLRTRPPVGSIVPLFRGSGESAPVTAVVAEVQSLLDDYLELESLCESPLARSYPAVYDPAGLGSSAAGAEVADRERKRLGLGDGPLPNLREVLEADVGLRIFCLPMPPRVSGLFAYSDTLGGCIAVQSAHPAGRQLWSLAHEYAHFLAHRYQAEVTHLRTERRGSQREVFAEAFARHFLMPSSGLRRRFHDLVRAGGVITPATLVSLTDLYGVTFEALVLRLEDLRLLRTGTWDELHEAGFRLGAAPQSLGMDDPGGMSLLPRRYVALAARAGVAGLITEGQLARFLRTDRQQARAWVRRLTFREDVAADGAPGQLELDLNRRLVADRGEPR